MKFGYCLSAFVVGCFMTVFMKANAPNEATASNTEMISSQTQVAENASVAPIEMNIQRQFYGVTKAGETVNQFVCTNQHGVVLEMIDYGATISAFRVPDQENQLVNIVLGCNNLQGYEACTSFFGSTIGRFANRIANAKFELDDGMVYQLSANDGKNQLHGGKVGFDKRVWNSEEIVRDNEVGVRFTLVSEDGDQGYPGNLQVAVEYTLNDENELKIVYVAETDKPTHVNLTNHAYWNLAGAGSGTALEHQIEIEADRFVTVDQESLPTGIASVVGTPLDFRFSTTIASRLDQLSTEPLGYDHCFILNRRPGQVSLVATAKEPESGRTMQVLTDQPGLQFYTGNYLNGQPSSGGFPQHQAFCLETQALPDSPNQPDFPATLLQPGEDYRHTTIYRFSLK